MINYLDTLQLTPSNLSLIKSGQISFLDLVNSGTVRYDDYNIQLLFCRFKDFASHSEIMYYYLKNDKNYKIAREEIMNVFNLVDIPSNAETVVDLLDDDYQGNDDSNFEDSDDEYTIPIGAEIIDADKYIPIWDGIKKEPVAEEPLPPPITVLGKRNTYDERPEDSMYARKVSKWKTSDVPLTYASVHDISDSDFLKLRELLNEYNSINK